MSKAWGLLLSPVIVASLAGCYPQPRYDALSIRQAGEQLEIAICADVQADYVEAMQSKPDSDGSFRMFWTYEPSDPLASGNILRTDADNSADGGTTREILDIRPGVEIGVNVSMYAAEGGRALLSSVFEVGADGLSDTEWQHSDGSVTAGAC